MSAPLSAAVLNAVNVLEPAPDLEVWDWAERKIRISPRVTSRPGPYRLANTPYCGGEWSPMWAARRYRVVNCVWAAQSGKSMMQQIILTYQIDCDPGPTMWVMPTQATCKRRSKKHIQPHLQDNLPYMITGAADDMQLYEIRLHPCDISLTWAGSPSNLASEPIRNLFTDEKAKYEHQDKSEAPPNELAEERTESYGEFARIFGVTTPTTADRPGWSDLADGSCCQYHVPCHECGEMQVMYFSAKVDRKWFENAGEFTGGIKWEGGRDATDEQIRNAYYECRHCGARWSNGQKNAAVLQGEWRAKYPGAMNYSCHLPSWYALTMTFARVVRLWLRSFTDTGKRHHFLNSRCAVPFEIEGKDIEPSALRAHCYPGHKSGSMPMAADWLILTADVMDDHLRYRVRAWSHDTTSWGIEEGVLMPELRNIEALLAKSWRKPDGKAHEISRALIDARWRRDEVYQLCLRNQGVVYPQMGHGPRTWLWQPVDVYVAANPSDGLPLSGMIKQINVSTDRWKERLFSRLEVTDGPGAWYLEEDISDDYLNQMSNEKKVITANKNGVEKAEWVKVGPNHALDCEVYQEVAAEVFQIWMPPAAETETAQSTEQQVNPYTGKPVGEW